MTAQLVVDIVTNASGAVAGFKKVDAAASSTASKTQSAGSKIAGFAKVVGGAFAVEKVAEFGKASVEAAQEAAVANERLVSVFKGAGDASGEAAKHAEEFAESLGKHIGVDPEVIKGGEAILATFHSVSDAAGRNAGIFDRATAAAADLAAAGFGDLKSNSVQLGKALEDPVKGMTALAKSGVTFTAAQKAQIKALEDSHQHLAAQKVILAAVEGQVKGTAAATATTGDKMKVAWQEAQESIGTALLPAVQKAQTAIQGIFNFISANSSWLLPMVAGIAGLAVAIKALSIGMKLWSDAVKVAKGIQAAWTAATKAAVAIQAAFDAVLDANPVVLIILAIIALIAGIVLLITHVSAVRRVMLEVWRTVASVAQSAFKIVLGAIAAVWNWIKSNWPYLLGILLGPFGLAAAAIYKNWSTIKAGGEAVWGWIRSAWSSIYSILVNPFASAISWIRGAWGTLLGVIEGVPGAIANALAGVFNAIIRPFQLAFHWIQDNILGPIKSVWNSVANTINGVHISTPEVKILNQTVIPAFHWSPPFHIPTLASGGVFDRATLAVVGEAGREVVAPEALLRSIVGQAHGDTYVTIKVEVPATANPAAVGRSVVDALRAYVRANGPIPGIAV